VPHALLHILRRGINRSNTNSNMVVLCNCRRITEIDMCFATRVCMLGVHECCRIGCGLSWSQPSAYCMTLVLL
jgi:hypothetical protein